MASRMKADDRRDQILHAAIECFGRYGYRGTTTARLAKAAHVSEPVLYRHFHNKQDLFIALMDHVAELVLKEWRMALAPLQSPMSQLRVLMRLNPATTDPETKQIYRIILAAQAEYDEPKIQDALRKHYLRYAQFLTVLLQQAQAAGQVREDVSASGLAWQLVHAAIGFAMLKPLDIPGHATPATVEQTTAMLIETLSRERAT